MQGLFVDDACYQLRIVTGDGVVYSEQEVGQVRTDDGDVTMTTPQGTVQGVCHNDGRVVWDNGETWRRLGISAAQLDVLLGRRTYVPLTLLFASVVYAGACWVKDWVVCGARRLAKRTA
jgi:hypothetical protein